MLTTTVDYEDEVCKVYYDPDVPCIIMEWKGFANSQAFRKGNEHVLAALVDRNVTKVIVDIRHMRVISITDQEWLWENWLPRAMRAGYRVCAMVTSEDFFNRVSVENVTKRIDPNQFTLQHFNSLLMARAWIKKINA